MQSSKQVYKLKVSTRKNKKFMLITPENKSIHFGDNRYEDYTQHKDEKRKQLYINRHAKQESRFWQHNQTNLETPAYLSRYLLWDQPTLNEGIRHIESSMGNRIDIVKET